MQVEVEAGKSVFGLGVCALDYFIAFGELMLNIEDYKNIHFIGIGGVSMSSIAISLSKRGLKVTGSDKNISKTTEFLKDNGILVHQGHSAANVNGANAVVFTGAIDDDNPELLEAKNKGIPVLRRTEVIDVFLQEHSINIAVSGTHGKTTTSSMCTAILEKAGKNPDFLIGATVPPYGSSHRLDGSDYLVLEACEYQANFLDFSPSTIIVNNIDYDHVDYYKSIEHVYDTFVKFANRLGEQGKLIVNLDDKYAARLRSFERAKVYTFGINEPADFMAKDIKLSKSGLQSYDFYVFGEKICRISMAILGMQNVYNSLGAFAAMHLNGVDVCGVKDALVDYHNALRRFELLIKKQDAMLVTDYAHHPAEIIATINAARSMHLGKLVVVFQPHTYTRTKILLKELSEAFDRVDKVYIADIDPIREEDVYGVSSMDLVKAIASRGKDVSYLGSLENLDSLVKKHLENDNLVIAMGAGAIDSYARRISL